MENREALLKAETDKLIEEGKKKGSLTQEEIMSKLEKIDATADEMEDVFKTIEAVVQVGETEDNFDKIMAEGSLDDSVKMYLKDIGRVPLFVRRTRGRTCKTHGRRRRGSKTHIKRSQPSSCRVDCKALRRQGYAVP
ncbi:MAG: hypothetical protein L6V85_00220 [Clostridiales bacterium]|nr:MAG: hypothetical protein L6V85_00220 [Clostridiales bacterium]